MRAPLNYFLPVTILTLFHFYSFHSGFVLLLYSGSRNPDCTVGWEVHWMVKCIKSAIWIGSFASDKNTKRQNNNNQQLKIAISYKQQQAV